MVEGYAWHRHPGADTARVLCAVGCCGPKWATGERGLHLVTGCKLGREGGDPRVLKHCRPNVLWPRWCLWWMCARGSFAPEGIACRFDESTHAQTPWPPLPLWAFRSSLFGLAYGRCAHKHHLCRCWLGYIPMLVFLGGFDVRGGVSPLRGVSAPAFRVARHSRSARAFTFALPCGVAGC